MTNTKQRQQRVSSSTSTITQRPGQVTATELSDLEALANVAAWCVLCQVQPGITQVLGSRPALLAIANRPVTQHLNYQRAKAIPVAIRLAALLDELAAIDDEVKAMWQVSLRGNAEDHG